MFYPMMYFDPTYLLVLAGVILSLMASARVKSTFSKYAKVRNSRGMTGAEAIAYIHSMTWDCMRQESMMFVLKECQEI